MINAYLSPLTAPSDTQIPTAFNELVAAVAQYLKVDGLASILGVNFGPNEPQAADRDKPWFKTTATGAPLGWYGWAGASWDKIPDVIANSATEDRPLNPPGGQVFFDTSINTLLVYDRGKWRTADGSPGDIKYVARPTLADALEANPGWIQFTDASGRVLGAAGEGSGLTTREFGDEVGEETHVLTVDETPSHTHTVTPPKGSNADNGDPGSLVVTADSQASSTDVFNGTTSSVGGDDAHNNMQPTLFVWCLIKE